jgi:hypothetical protein
MDKTWLIYAALLLAGAFLAPYIRKIPVIGSHIPA